MPDLLWDDVRNFFDPELMGALPDVSVENASAADWQLVLDLVRASDWRWEYSEGAAVLPLPLPRAEQVLSRSPDAECSALSVWPVPGVRAIFRFYSADKIDFAVDLRELQGQDGVDVLCDFLSAVGRRLGKSVLMAPETDPHHPVLGFDCEAGRVMLLADPRIN